MWFDIDQEYPGAKSFAISVTSSGASDYILNGTDRSGSVSGNDISLSLHIYDTLVLSVNASGHPLYINTANTTGTGSQVNNPSADNNGSENGTITWTPTTSGTYYYNCQYHASMSGIITVTEDCTVICPNLTQSLVGITNIAACTCCSGWFAKLSGHCFNKHTSQLS